MPSVGNTLALTRLVGASVRKAVVVWASRCAAPVTVAVTRYTVSYASTPFDFHRPVAGSHRPLTKVPSVDRTRTRARCPSSLATAIGASGATFLAPRDGVTRIDAASAV